MDNNSLINHSIHSSDDDNDDDDENHINNDENQNQISSNEENQINNDNERNKNLTAKSTKFYLKREVKWNPIVFSGANFVIQFGICHHPIHVQECSLPPSSFLRNLWLVVMKSHLEFSYPFTQCASILQH